MQKQSFYLVSIDYQDKREDKSGYLADLCDNDFRQEVRNGNVCINIALTWEEHDAQRVGSPEEARDFLHEVGVLSGGELIPALRKLVTAIRLVPIEYNIGNKQSESIVPCYTSPTKSGA